ncbi:hypothetical protein D3C75_762620 [compost metagenome]
MVIELVILPLSRLQRQLFGGEQKLTLCRTGSHLLLPWPIDGTNRNLIKPGAGVIVQHPLGDKGLILIHRKRHGTHVDRPGGKGQE